MKKLYYVLGRGYKNSDIKKEHPYEVWMDMSNTKMPLVMLEGRGFGSVGGNFSPSEILKEHWQEHLSVSGTEWLRSLCQDALMNGDIIDFKSVIETYNYIHNSMPEIRNL
ncbi:hypothetical protein QE250_15760 [Chromatiaceae bacterium AAb-1]|nr:hypothetical protein [Chromatiaceae bacterium AAb-1]